MKKFPTAYSCFLEEQKKAARGLRKDFKISGFLNLIFENRGAVDPDTLR